MNLYILYTEFRYKDLNKFSFFKMLNRSISLESQGNFNILKFWFNASNNIPSSALDDRTYPCDKKFDLFYRFDEMHAYLLSYIN